MVEGLDSNVLEISWSLCFTSKASVSPSEEAELFPQYLFPCLQRGWDWKRLELCSEPAWSHKEMRKRDAIPWASCTPTLQCPALLPRSLWDGSVVAPWLAGPGDQGATGTCWGTGLGQGWGWPGAGQGQGALRRLRPAGALRASTHKKNIKIKVPQTNLTLVLFHRASCLSTVYFPLHFLYDLKSTYP